MKLFSILIVMLLLAVGCTSAPQEQPPAAAQQQQERQHASVEPTGDPLTVEQYDEALFDANNRLGEAMARINETLGAEINGAWFDEAIASYGQLEQTLPAFRVLNPPDEFRQGHNLLLEAVGQYEQGVAIAYGHLRAQDLQSLSEINSYFNEAFRLNGLAFDELAERRDAYYDNLAMMIERTKELDEAAGIDRYSVEENISADGQELVGKWGLTDEQGVFHVFISLEEDGAYYGYKRGEYPELTNGMIGAWSYDKQTHTISFATERNMEDGVAADVHRQDMQMEVLYFKDGELRMRDTETFNGFTYFRAE